MKLSALLAAVLFGLAALATPLKIGITQIVDHPALNAVRQGVIDVLAEAGYVEGENVEYVLGNAQGDFSVAMSIAQNFLAQGVDLVVSIATPTSQAAVQVFKDTSVPVVFSAVTDPVGAGLTGYPNVTGTSDMIDVASDLALLKELVPGLTKVGMVYNPGEANSAILTDMAKDAGGDLGLEIVAAAAENTAAVPLAAQSLIGRVQAIYVTTDNTVVSALESVVDVAKSQGIPLLVADPSSLERGALVCTGFDYYDHGRMTGELVLKILQGASPADLPVEYQKGTQVWLNLDMAGEMGFSFPQAIEEKATGLLFGGRRFVIKD
ncbi:MAG TPA: ABC transporter substrate-binding protein [Candidatus Acetothermia bacterium]|nr:ABC transporter substrate-binding protein [Candidatus Acetothermia bacterium]